MSAARIAPELEAEFIDLGEQRRTDRRASDRRAPRRKLDPMFAATLVNQIAKPEQAHQQRYAPSWRGPGAGSLVNVRT